MTALGIEKAHLLGAMKSQYQEVPAEGSWTENKDAEHRAYEAWLEHQRVLSSCAAERAVDPVLRCSMEPQSHIVPKTIGLHEKATDVIYDIYLC